MDLAERFLGNPKSFWAELRFPAHSAVCHHSQLYLANERNDNCSHLKLRKGQDSPKGTYFLPWLKKKRGSCSDWKRSLSHIGWWRNQRSCHRFAHQVMAGLAAQSCHLWHPSGLQAWGRAWSPLPGWKVCSARGGHGLWLAGSGFSLWWCRRSSSAKYLKALCCYRQKAAAERLGWKGEVRDRDRDVLGVLWVGLLRCIYNLRYFWCKVKEVTEKMAQQVRFVRLCVTRAAGVLTVQIM